MPLASFRAAGSDADAYYNLAFVYATQDQADKAKHCFQMALNADPTHSARARRCASFEEYDRAPPDMHEEEMYADDGVRYVPYVEQAEGSRSDQGVQQAGAHMPLPSSRDASRTNRALQMESRGLLNRNMQSQRNDAAAAQGGGE